MLKIIRLFNKSVFKKNNDNKLVFKKNMSNNKIIKFGVSDSNKIEVIKKSRKLKSQKLSKF